MQDEPSSRQPPKPQPKGPGSSPGSESEEMSASASTVSWKGPLSDLAAHDAAVGDENRSGLPCEKSLIRSNDAEVVNPQEADDATAISSSSPSASIPPSEAGQELVLGQLSASAQEASTPADPSDLDLEGSIQSHSAEAVDDVDGPTVISRSPDGLPPPADPNQTPADALAKRLVGTKLDHYELEEYIGGGGMGAVFRAYDSLLKRTVAVKILSKGATDQDLLRRFVNEAQSAAKLDHENIARVFFVGRDQSLNYIVFEYVEGQNLRQLIADDGVLPLGLALRYMCQLARALEHAAARKVIHRDIKPSNVVITPDHRVKLVDMGLARIHHLDSQQAELTASDMTLGTFDYISPEQARDPRSADTRSDLYSLGCTFYYMLTGEPPFPDGTALQKVLAHGEAPRPDPRLLRPETPDCVVRIIHRLIVSNPELRFQSPNELLAELLVAAAELNIDVGLNESYIIETSVDRRDWLDQVVPWVVAGLALGLIVGLIELMSPPAISLSDAQPSYRNVSESSEASMTANSETGGNGSDRAPLNPTGTNSASSTAQFTEIRVGNAPAAPGAMIVATFQEAIEASARNNSIQEIQLWFDGEQPAQPFAVRSPALRIVAGTGRRPRLKFTTNLDNMSTNPLVRLYGGEFEWRGVDIDWQIDPATSVTPGALFRIEQNYLATFPDLLDPPSQDFNFVDARVSIQIEPQATSEASVGRSPSSISASPTAGALAPLAARPSANFNVENGPSMLEIVRPDSFFLGLPRIGGVQFPRLLVRRILLRGPCRLVRASPGTPFLLQWEQSVFASPLSALRLGGLRRDASIGSEARLRIEMRQVTTLGASLVEMQPAEASPIVIPCDLLTDGCWFVANAPKSLVRYRLSQATEQPELLRWTGGDNVVSGTTSLWAVTSATGVTTQIDGSMSLAGTPLQELNALEQQTVLPETLTRFLTGSNAYEQFEPSDLVAAFAQLPAGATRRPGVAPEDLPAAQATSLSTPRPQSSRQ